MRIQERTIGRQPHDRARIVRLSAFKKAAQNVFFRPPETWNAELVTPDLDLFVRNLSRSGNDNLIDPGNACSSSGDPT